MLLPGSEINSFDKVIASNSDFFTGSMNLEKLNFDPLITGYAFIIWTKVPTWVEAEYPSFKKMTQTNFKSFDGISDMTLNSVSYAHTFNGNEYFVPSNITKENTEFTLKHQEFSGSPIKNMYQYWVSGIRDPLTNIATYPTKASSSDTTLQYAAKNHTGSLLYIVTRPDANNFDGHNVEFAAYYSAVFPTKIPIGHFNYAQNTNDAVEIDMTFKGDMHIGPHVDNFAQTKIKEVYEFLNEGDFIPEFAINDSSGTSAETQNSSTSA